MKYNIKEIVKDTYTNSSGSVLLSFLNNYLHKGQQVTLSFKGAPPTSTSFLNSSIGELLDQYGFNRFKEIVKLTDLSATQAQILKNYFLSFDLKN